MKVKTQIAKYIMTAAIINTILVAALLYHDIIDAMREWVPAWGKPEPAVVSDLAYTVNRWIDNIIYIEEYGELTPYLVLDDDYGIDGNTLLLRYYLTDEVYTMTEEGDYGNYYNGCMMDRYLQGEYADQFDIVDIVCDTNVEIACQKDYEGTEYITRKFFLLSAHEICQGKRRNVVEKEGEELSYFKEADNRNAYTEQNEMSTRWLRSKVLGGDYHMAFYIFGRDAFTFGDGKHATNHIRPAFCLKDDTPVKQQNLNGKDVYVLAR